MPPKQAVNAPPAVPPLLSLLSMADVIENNNPDLRWEAGFSYEPEACGGSDSTGVDDPCNVGEQTVVLGPEFVDVEPFLIYAGDSCSTIGAATRDWKGRARRKLAACESNLIESELWRGTQARLAGWTNKWLAHPDADDLSPGVPVSALQALACLEQGLAECNCGSQGMIHATPQIVTLWAAQNLIIRDGRQLTTHLGTLVVPGSGYDGSGPAPTELDAPVAAANGSVWAYATDIVHVRLGSANVVPSTMDEAVDRLSNLATFRAERIVSATWDCCHLAIAIDADLCGIGS